MSIKGEITNGSDKRNRDIENFVTDIELYPVIEEEQLCLDKYTKLPLSQITSLGTAFESLTAAFGKVMNRDGSTSGLYRVTLPKGGKLAKLKNGSGYIGSVLNSNGAVGGGQAVLNPLTFNPAMLFMATSLANINRKLDRIEKMQQKFYELYEKKQRSDLMGALDFTVDILKKYRYNSNNNIFIDNSYGQVQQNTKLSAGRINYYRSQIITIMNQKTLIYGDRMVKKQVVEIQSIFKDYQLALYLYSLSLFLEVVFLKNFQPEFLNDAINKLESYSRKYSELSTKCINQISKNAQSSVQSRIIKGTSSVSREVFPMGLSVAKAITSTTSMFITNAMENIHSNNINQITNNFEQSIGNPNDYVQPFVENISTINTIYNQPLELVFDNESIYIGTTQNS